MEVNIKKYRLKIYSNIIGINGNCNINYDDIDNIEYNKISIVNDNIFNNIIYIKDIFYKYVKDRELYIKNIDNRIIDSLKIVGLNKNIMNKTINEISTSEKVLIKISVSIINNPNLIIIDDIFNYLDKTNIKKVNLLFNRLVDKFDKAIIIISDNSDRIFENCNYCIFIKDDKILVRGKTIDIFKRVDYLKRNGFLNSSLCEFVYKAKSKNIKIDYYKDVRDLIKDIYRNKK